MKFSSIVDSVRNQVATILGSDWYRLSHVYDIEKNDRFTIKNGYGVRTLSASEIDEILCNIISVDHSIEIILTTDYAAGDNDENIETQIKMLQDKVEEIYKSLVYKKIDGNIIIANQLEIAEPEFLDDNNSIAQRFSVVFRYRVNLA